MDSKLKLQFDPHTIEHLGIKMYSQLPFALAELVANAYDAGASTVNIALYDDADQKKIVVEDNGEGMSYQELGDKFLIIGRKRRETDSKRENSKGRKITGKKGLGKLALFGIGKTIKITTTKKDQEDATQLVLDWDQILGETSGTYYPDVQIVNKKEGLEEGTIIELSNLSRVSPFDIQSTAISLSKLFNCLDADFVVNISHNGDEPITLTRDLRYEGMEKQFEWDIEDIVSQIDYDYEHKGELKGYIVSSSKPMKPDLRGILLYVNGRMANTASFFGLPEAGHTFSYISGWIDADYLDEYDMDLISTDRQSISWEMPEAEELQKYLQKVVRFLVNDWSKRRRDAKNIENTGRAGINAKEWIEKVPVDIRPKLENVINNLASKPELDEDEYSTVIHQMHDLIPPYTYYHYRLLHGEIRDASKKPYEDRDYYTAFLEAMKRYKNAVKDKAGLQVSDDTAIMSNAFGRDPNKPLKTAAKYKYRPNGKEFSQDTLNNIEEGQLALSRGIAQGARNVLSHEEHIDLSESGLFSEKDCLDMLSILSHLFRRLDDAEIKPEDKTE